MKASNDALRGRLQKPLLPRGDLPKAWRSSVCGQLKTATSFCGNREPSEEELVEAADTLFPVSDHRPSRAPTGNAGVPL
jgi:hypothetical protein